MNKPILPSTKHFGMFFSLVFACLTLYMWWTVKPVLATSFGTLFTITILMTTIRPNLLDPFNKAWFKLGILIGKIMNPIVLGAIFFLLITPISLCLKLIKRDELSLRDLKKTSFWKLRCSNDLPENSFKNQF